ncbi:hypothetical protein [Hydrogenophaga sp.]|uniref:hypothetical protein n=1 Tax=Hydrogenophaga sp. TaxID=1904254 RepID=UPI002FCC9CD0
MPDSETLRQTALRASWQRDQRVGRRRRWARWLAWAFWRYGLALLMVAGAVSLVVLWLLPLASGWRP